MKLSKVRTAEEIIARFKDGQIIAIGGLAITEGMTLDELRHQILPHPTVAEIFHEAAYMAED